MEKIISLLIVFCAAHFSFSQEEKANTWRMQPDSLSPRELDEIVIIANPSSNYLKENKMLGNLDHYLKNSNAINMLKRGAYAWEPLLNGMSTERSVITIDGMRIFHACTDKMDPVTSYIESTNLAEAEINEGQAGTAFGGTIAGSINLIKRKTGFSTERKSGGLVFLGFEHNNQQKIYGAAMHTSAKKIFADIDFTFRKANNYRAGFQPEKNNEIKFSQFTKYNLATTGGYKINKTQELEASVILDRATDVGYPGLTMDVSLAKAIIASLQYRYTHLSDVWTAWENKIYFNTITHIMDDRHRPDVILHMDMPGWSQTTGFYSQLNGRKGIHSFQATASGYHNQSLAEMTMYPVNPHEKEMFMLTWPNVHTQYIGLNMEDKIMIHAQWILSLQGGGGFQRNEIKSESGLNSLQLFYPDLISQQNRNLKNISFQLSYYHDDFNHQWGMGYGDRAPSISESYGFYLLNINDNYDYMGNPYLKNEKSIHFHTASTFRNRHFFIKAKINYFYILDYIIGKPVPDILPMNMTANGVKLYRQLNSASILNTAVNIDYKPTDRWTFSAASSWRYGEGSDHTVIPWIQPFTQQIKIRHTFRRFSVESSTEGSTRNRNSIEFGETQKPAFVVTHLFLSEDFAIKNYQLTLKVGVENVFNHYYATFDNWAGIPQMGRNIYTHLSIQF